MATGTMSSRSTRRWFLKTFTVAASGALAPLLAACGGGTPTESPKPAATSPPAKSTTAPAKTDASPKTDAPPKTQATPKAAAPPKSAESVTLVWDTFRGVGTPYPDEIINTFKQKFPNVTIEFRPLPTSQTDSYPKLYAMYAAGNIGDLYAFDPVDYEFYRAVPQGLVLALDDYISRDNYDTKQFFEIFMDLQMLNGKTWGLPSWGHPGDCGLVFNEPALAEVGRTLPEYKSDDWTMESLYETLVALQKTASGRVERFGSYFGLGMRHMTIIARAFNGDLISQDGKTATVTSPETTEGMKWMYDLCQTDKVVALPGSFEGSSSSLFASARLGMMQTSAVGMFNTRELLKDKDPNQVKIKTTLIPKRPDGVYPSQTRGGTWQIGSRSQQPDWAWEFVKHKASREGALAFTRLSQSSVALVRPDVLDDPFLDDPNFTPYRETLLRAVPNLVPANARGTELQDAFAQAHSLIYLGKVPFDQGLKDLNDALQRVLDKPAT